MSTTATEHPTRDELAATIADLRARAKRYSLTDDRRKAIDDEVDALVEDWIAAQ